MNRAFLEKYCQELPKKPVSRQWYNPQVLPCVDTCSTCNSLSTIVLNTADNAQKNEVQMALEFHDRIHECAIQAMQADNIRNAKHTSFMLCRMICNSNFMFHNLQILKCIISGN